MKCPDFKNGMKKSANNRFFPFIYGIAGFAYITAIGLLDYLVNTSDNPWITLAFVIPMEIFSVFILYMCIANIKDVTPKDIYLPPIIFSILFNVLTYGFTLICPNIFLRQAYWTLTYLYGLTAICIAIITVIPKIPRKRYVILSYLGVIILAFISIAGTIYNCFCEFTMPSNTLEVLLIIREGILN